MATQLFQPPVGSPAWFHACVEEAKSGPITKVVDMGPALAKEMLSDNADNRSVRHTKFVQYSSDMASGKWAFNGEPIIISKEGKLNDGQHRCLAAIDANATIKTLIVFGVDRESRVTVDQGGARSAGDYLGMEGVANAAMQAAIARMVIGYESTGGQGLGNNSTISNAEVCARVHKDSGIAEAATFGHTHHAYSRNFVAGSVVGFAYYILARHNRDEARQFLSRVCRGDGLKMRDPAHTLREKLIGKEDRGREKKVALIFKAWNFNRRGMKVGASSLNSKTPFPAIL
jgi:hypothetical protein